MKLIEWSLCLLFTISGYFCANKNVLILLADDLGLQMGIYNSTDCKTPNLDQLARKSVIFRKSFTSVSSCSPSRAALLTGLPNHQNGMYGLHQETHHFNSFDAIQSLPKILREQKIRTGIIGKKHVGPEKVYPFDFQFTEQESSILQVGRNITHIKLLVRRFLTQNDQRPFLLYVAFHDPHRCGHTNPQLGVFCERFGSGEPGMGLIPDWNPTHYDPSKLEVPSYIQQTEAARDDLAAYYTTISRLDQGVGLVLKELEASGYLDNTLVMFSSDNGPPFPNGRTNLYEPGVQEPLLISNPHSRSSWGKEEDALVSLTDIVPTILDWFGLPLPRYKLFGRRVTLFGKTLLPFTRGELGPNLSGNVFFSHNLHEITMYYPMRGMRTHNFKLIHNINWFAPFPIDQDFYLSPTFQDLLNRTVHSQSLYWTKNLTTYYQRSEWELYDLRKDPQELNNIIKSQSAKNVTDSLKKLLRAWQRQSGDPWLCAPHSVLEDKGRYKTHPTCLKLYN